MREPTWNCASSCLQSFWTWEFFTFWLIADKIWWKYCFAIIGVIFTALYFKGFLEHEFKKDDIVMLDTGENPDAPLPREMIDLEVDI